MTAWSFHCANADFAPCHSFKQSLVLFAIVPSAFRAHLGDRSVGGLNSTTGSSLSLGAWRSWDSGAAETTSVRPRHRSDNSGRAPRSLRVTRCHTRGRRGIVPVLPVRRPIGSLRRVSEHHRLLGYMPRSVAWMKNHSTFSLTGHTRPWNIFQYLGEISFLSAMLFR